MQIDWLTVAAQVVNFLILVYLLRRFLYRPVMAAMARREARIAQQLKQAESREQAAAQEAARYRERTEAFAREREAQLGAVAKEVEARRKALLEEVREEVDATRLVWQKDVERERLEFLRLFKPQAAAALTRAARQMLADMADAELEQQLIRTFVKQLETLDHTVLAALRKSAHKAGEIRVTTSFEADADTRARIRRAIQHHLLEDRDTEIEFRRSEALLCGIEVNTDGRKLGWTVDNYLQTLEQELERVFAQAQGSQEPLRA